MFKDWKSVVVVCLLLISAGCSGMSAEITDTESSENQNTRTAVRSPSESVSNKNTSNSERSFSDSRINYSRIFLSVINDSDLDINRTNIDENTFHLAYYGNFSNDSRTTRELSYIAASFAAVLNKSYHNQTNWSVTRLHITGKSYNGSVIWDTVVEDWWALNYVNNNWGFENYLSAITSSGELWNLTTNKPPDGGEKYIGKIQSRLQKRSNIHIISIDKHGGEAFLTYETDYELNSSQYFDQVANVVDVYKNLTLPRSLNRTEGWYAGVLNIEVRNGSDTLEWYRYRIRWAEQRVRGEMAPAEEAGRLRLSRFLEKDRLRDDPDTVE